MHVQIDADCTVLAYGHFPTPHEDPSITIVEIDDAEAAKFEQPGVKTLAADSTIVITPPTPGEQG